jgi:tRNA 5-methylaminomethyl-2-thiouridine biosynthesis bifunctional protein
VRFAPITPARITFGAAGEPPLAPDFGDVYHPRAGALGQARHVFLGGNGLPARWQRRARFVVLETGFGLGHNFLATWAAWRDDGERCERLWFVSIDKHPPTRDDLARAHAASPLPSLAAPLVAAWPPLTPDLHTLAFDNGRVMLCLAFGDVAQWLPQLVLDADAFYLDGFAPDRNPVMWDAALLKQLAGRAVPGATAATWSVARPLREGLAAAGFEVQRAPGFGGKREMTVARFTPRFVPKRARPPGRRAPAEAVIVGGGLAGAAAAWALAAEGWSCTVFDRHAEPAAETSGNPGGLFHGSVPADDGAHARALRAAALLAASTYAPLLHAGAVVGQAQGLLQASGTSFEATHARVERHALPGGYAQAFDAAEASARAGVRMAGPAWYYPGGGWLAPPSWVRHALDHPSIRWRGATTVHALQRDGEAWLLLDDDGHPLARSATVVLANAHDALRLLGQQPWPLQRVRGQVTLLGAGLANVPRPALPLTGDGYALVLPDGRLLCGATRGAGDAAAALRAADHAYNLQRLQALCGSAPTLDAAALAALDGRVGWRLAAADRLPVVGPAPCAASARERDAARVDGLFVATAFGARGITWAPLAGALVAAWAAGAPFPLGGDLIDAFDPARFAVRAARRVRTSAS